MNEGDIVVGMVALNGGELVGRTRLQKQAYLLERCGANFGLQFTYHHYGPYSFDLVNELTDARAEERITMGEKPGRHGVPYAIFKSKPGESPSSLGDLSACKARAFLKKMGEVSDIVLELAATIVFLRDEWDYYGRPPDTADAAEQTEAAVCEVKTRKPLKATDDRIAKAKSLLCALGLWEYAAPTTP